jgi:heme-degrading monooxygenase HmoA
MIVREFRAWAEGDKSAAYVQHFASQVQPRLSRIDGYRRALVLTRKQGAETEIVVVTFFDRLENVKGFAGEQYEIAKVDPVAQTLLSRYDKTVSHFELALELSSSGTT